MSQNRNKLLSLFIGNLSNAVIHKVLEEAIDNQEITLKYESEIKNSFNLALKYREKINPINTPLPLKDIIKIENKIYKNAVTELRKREQLGYNNIDLSIIPKIIENLLNKSQVK